MKTKNLITTSIALCLILFVGSTAWAAPLTDTELYFDPDSITPDFYARIELPDLSIIHNYSWDAGSDPVTDADILPVLKPGDYQVGYVFSQSDYYQTPNVDYYADLTGGTLTATFNVPGVYHVRITRQSGSEDIYAVLAESWLAKKDGSPDTTGANKKVPVPEGDLFLVDSSDGNFENHSAKIFEDAGRTVERVGTRQEVIDKIKAYHQTHGERKFHVEIGGHGAPGNQSTGASEQNIADKQIDMSSVADFQKAIDDYVNYITFQGCSVGKGATGKNFLQILADSIGKAGAWNGTIYTIDESYFTVDRGTEFVVESATKAWNPCPNNISIDISSTPILSWTPGAYADTHDVYFGTNFNDVNDANRTNDPCGVLVKQDHDSNSIDITDLVGTLQFDTTYYWRVDEVNDACDASPWEGMVWRFTTKFEILDPHLLLWYTFDEGSGDWVFDNSGHGLHSYDGSVSGNWIPDGGRFGGCLDFDDEVGLSVDTRVLSDIGAGISISVWLDGYRKNYRNCVLQAGAGGYYIDVIVPDGWDDYVYWRAGNDTNDLLLWDTATPRGWEGDWHHFVFIKDEGTETMSIYFDASLVKTKSGTISTLSNIANQPFKVGALLDEGSAYVGTMDDLRVYDYAIPKSKVEELFRGGDLARAWGPEPYNGEGEAPFNIDLVWRPGDYASSHDVYFGTSWDEVNEANSTYHPGVDYNNVDVTSYDVGGLDLETTYYWRVDEVNDPNVWKGDVWRFTVAEYITVDDFEEYEEGFADEQPGSWEDGWTPPYNGSTLTFRSSPYPVRGGEMSMEYWYDNSFNWGPGYYSEASTEDLNPTDWIQQGVEVLTLWFYGDPDNDAGDTEQMYVGLEDSDGNYHQVDYGDGEGEEMNDIKIPDWQEWNIILTSFTDLNLASVEKVFIGFGVRGSLVPGGIGTVYFDDIRLYPPMCRPEKIKPAADLNNDCRVDFGDVDIMADEWLETDVNLGEVVWPDPDGLVGWWKLDDGAGNIATDYAGYDHNGVILTIDEDVWWVIGRDNVNSALEFDGGRILVPDDQHLKPMDQVSASAWINYSEEQNSARVVVKGADNKETFHLMVSGDDELVFHVVDGNDYAEYRVASDVDALDRDEWIHIAGTYDGNAIKCHINGEVAGEDVNGVLILFLSQDTNDLAIGNRPDDTDRPFIGTIDDVRVYNYGLSAEEVAYIASDGTGIFSVQSVANLYNAEDLGERAVNLRDFAVLADGWLNKELWP